MGDGRALSAHPSCFCRLSPSTLLFRVNLGFMYLLTRCSSRLPVLEDASPPPSPKLLGNAMMVEAAAPLAVTTVEDEASHLEA